MYRMVLSCRSAYSKDGRGVFVKFAHRMDKNGPVFVKYGESLLVGEPELGVEHASLVGWIAPLDTATLVSTGEWQADRIAGPHNDQVYRPEEYECRQ